MGNTLGYYCPGAWNIKKDEYKPSSVYGEINGFSGIPPAIVPDLKVRSPIHMDFFSTFKFLGSICSGKSEKRGLLTKTSFSLKTGVFTRLLVLISLGTSPMSISWDSSKSKMALLIAASMLARSALLKHQK